MFSVRSAKMYCKDDISKIPGYADAVSSSDFWEIHHILELTLQGEYAHSMKELIRMGMYYNRPYYELIFMPRKQHQKMHLHANNPVHKYTKETWKKHAIAMIGHYGWNRGKKWSASTKEKMRVAHTGLKHREESKRMISIANQKRYSAYKQYKSDGGMLNYNGFSRDIWPSIKEAQNG